MSDSSPCAPRLATSLCRRQVHTLYNYIMYIVHVTLHVLACIYVYYSINITLTERCSLECRTWCSASRLRPSAGQPNQSRQSSAKYKTQVIIMHLHTHTHTHIYIYTHRACTEAVGEGGGGTHGVHCRGEEEVREAEVAVQDLVGVQVQQTLDHLAKDAPNCGHKNTTK